MKEVVIDKFPGDYETATVLHWKVEEGDAVREGQTLVKLNLEGKSYSLAAPLSGFIQDIYIDEGEEVKVGDVIASVDESKSGENSVEVDAD